MNAVNMGDVRYENIPEIVVSLKKKVPTYLIYSCHMNEIMIWMWLFFRNKDDLWIPKPEASSFLLRMLHGNVYCWIFRHPRGHCRKWTHQQHRTYLP